MTNSVEIFPIKCRRRFGRFKLDSAIVEELRENHVELRDGDILVVSSKFAAVSEGRTVELDEVKPGKRAKNLANSYKLKPELAQIVLEQSQAVLGGIPGFLLAMNRGILAPNAGIDTSNAPEGWIILYPKDANRTASKLRKRIISALSKRGKKINRLGIVVSDSRVTPTRLGTVGVAIATAGIRPTIDLRGRTDLFGNTLKVTLVALADQIATAAEICMGEANESVPVILVRGVSGAFDRPRNEYEKTMVIPPEKCLIISGIASGKKLSSLRLQ